MNKALSNLNPRLTRSMKIGANSTIPVPSRENSEVSIDALGSSSDFAGFDVPVGNTAYSIESSTDSSKKSFLYEFKKLFYGTDIDTEPCAKEKSVAKPRDTEGFIYIPKYRTWTQR